jgi:hypothetical protein
MAVNDFLKERWPRMILLQRAYYATISVGKAGMIPMEYLTSSCYAFSMTAHHNGPLSMQYDRQAINVSQSFCFIVHRSS